MKCKGLFSALLKACEHFRMSREREFDLVLGDKRRRNKVPALAHTIHKTQLLKHVPPQQTLKIKQVVRIYILTLIMDQELTTLQSSLINQLQVVKLLELKGKQKSKRPQVQVITRLTAPILRPEHNQSLMTLVTVLLLSI